MELLSSLPHNPFREVPQSAWRSEQFIAGLFCFQGYFRLSIVRVDGGDQPMSWEELQAVKSACGFGAFDGVEVYPRDIDVVNTGNARHIFIFQKPLAFAMRTQPGGDAPFFSEV